ncbi:hypothetical protein GUJ93_ZPchr0014g46762 [Zizania palustris]|uniref:Uncharacterized protein n=1 Tax=Zizania palustris TaxID=103762 RepID=A0A8J5TG00_ZIZPA|nr:hypothetical protein GUJ93_ZPchr0014g46762 [Zizania palustris]
MALPPSPPSPARPDLVDPRPTTAPSSSATAERTPERPRGAQCSSHNNEIALGGNRRSVRRCCPDLAAERPMPRFR